MRPPEAPFCLDMAASVVAAGKLEIARRRGKPIPDGWVKDGAGEDVSDPDVYYESEGMGGILPLGSDDRDRRLEGLRPGDHGRYPHRRAQRRRTPAPSCPVAAPTTSSRAMRIDAFTSVESFYDQMLSMKETLRAAPRLPGAGPLTFAGEPEAAFEADCRAHGIPYHPSVVESLQRMCAEIGIEYDL